MSSNSSPVLRYLGRQSTDEEGKERVRLGQGQRFTVEDQHCE